ncbi:MAG TPA: FAD-dependent oxidoreductase, partial [Micromonospora sp.]
AESVREGDAGERFAAALDAVRAAVADISADESPQTLTDQGIVLVTGEAAFAGPGRLTVGQTVLAADRVVLATGATAALPPVPGLPEVAPYTNENFFGLDRLPRRLVVVGAGPTGLELAQAMARFGTRVTLVEAADRVAAREEPEVDAVLRTALARQGVRLELGCALVGARRLDTGEVELRAADGRSVRADAVLCATGRRPSTDRLDLASAGVRRDSRGFVVVDEYLRTSAPGIYAAGDVVAGGKQFTHAAADMGVTAARNALGHPPRVHDDSATPSVIFTSPEVGRVGLTEAEAVGRPGDAVVVSTLPAGATDRARICDERDGFVKLVARRDGRTVGELLGATVVCPRAGEVLHELSLAVRLKIPVIELARAVHAYPTWSMLVGQAAARIFTGGPATGTSPGQRA